MENKKSSAAHEYRIDNMPKSLLSQEANVEVKIEPEMTDYGGRSVGTNINAGVLGMKRAGGQGTEDNSNATKESSLKYSAFESSRKPQAFSSVGGYSAELDDENFIPHVVHVCKGEDILGKLLSYVQQPPWEVCVLSATGMVSDVVLVETPGSANKMSFKGQFEILRLSGTFKQVKLGGNIFPMGKLCVLLAKPDGQVFGGVVDSAVIAANPVQLILATFKPNVVKLSKGRLSADM